MDKMAALGVYVTQSRLARDAALRRCAVLGNLATDARRAADDAGQPVRAAAMFALVEEAEVAHAGMLAAIDAANAAAAECGEPALSVARVAREMRP